MPGIADRIRQILKLRGISERELARRAWLTESHVGLLLKNLEEDPGAIEWRTIRDIARGGGVDPGWLAMGRGDPSPKETEEPDLRTLGDRFRFAVEKRGVPVADLDKLLQTERGYARKLGRDLLEHRDPKILDRAAALLHVNAEWLLFHRGEMDAGPADVLEAELRLATQEPELHAQWQRVRAKRVGKAAGDEAKNRVLVNFLKPGMTDEHIEGLVLDEQRKIDLERASKRRRRPSAAAERADVSRPAKSRKASGAR